jgi:hypothetical protein
MCYLYFIDIEDPDKLTFLRPDITLIYHRYILLLETPLWTFLSTLPLLYVVAYCKLTLL